MLVLIKALLQIAIDVIQCFSKQHEATPGRKGGSLHTDHSKGICYEMKPQREDQEISSCRHCSDYPVIID